MIFKSDIQIYRAGELFVNREDHAKLWIENSSLSLK